MKYAVLILVLFCGCRTVSQKQIFSFGGAWNNNSRPAQSKPISLGKSDSCFIQDKTEIAEKKQSNNSNFNDVKNTFVYAESVLPRGRDYYTDTSLKDREVIFDETLQRKSSYAFLQYFLTATFLGMGWFFILQGMSHFFMLSFLNYLMAAIFIGLAIFFYVFSRRIKRKNKLSALNQMKGMMYAMLLKPDAEGMELLTHMMLKMLHQYRSKAKEHEFIAKWYEGSIYLFNADQRQKLGKILNLK